MYKKRIKLESEREREASIVPLITNTTRKESKTHLLFPYRREKMKTKRKKEKIELSKVVFQMM